MGILRNLFRGPKLSISQAHSIAVRVAVQAASVGCDAKSFLDRIDDFLAIGLIGYAENSVSNEEARAIAKQAFHFLSESNALIEDIAHKERLFNVRASPGYFETDRHEDALKKEREAWQALNRDSTYLREYFR
jgi:hypothetical protein